jgi:hypothetical protein
MTTPRTVLFTDDDEHLFESREVDLEARRHREDDGLREWRRLARFPVKPVTGRQVLAVIEELAVEAV